MRILPEFAARLEIGLAPSMSPLRLTTLASTKVSAGKILVRFQTFLRQALLGFRGIAAAQAPAQPYRLAVAKRASGRALSLGT